MKLIKKDILTVENGIICQQVNCQGAFGAGLAKQIRNKWPKVYEEYIIICKNNLPDFTLLGQYFVTDISLDLKVCSIFGQLNYGTKERQTDYAALVRVFDHMKSNKSITNNINKGNLYFPYMFSCGLAGGDWNIVSKMIDYYFPDAFICQLSEPKKEPYDKFSPI